MSASLLGLFEVSFDLSESSICQPCRPELEMQSKGAGRGEPASTFIICGAQSSESGICHPRGHCAPEVGHTLTCPRNLELQRPASSASRYTISAERLESYGRASFISFIVGGFILGPGVGRGVGRGVGPGVTLGPGLGLGVTMIVRLWKKGSL